MKAPDRIYIDTDLIAFHVLNEKHKGDIEYIRKDALLDFIKEKGNAVRECDATEERKVAALSVIDFLTDKIKSL